MAIPSNTIEGWQAKTKNIGERVKFMFNNTLISDISFATRSSEGTKVIHPAHKFILAVSSPVFYAMFYGELSENKAQIELPDCDSESFLEFLRFLYCDECELTGSCVMQVYYLAKKYIVPELENTCLAFLRENLSSGNVFDILPQALKFEDNDLVARCWEVVDTSAEEAVKSESFLSVTKELLNRTIERDTLSVHEIDLFHAVDRWAITECERQRVEPSKENKLTVTGEETVRKIRFPLMTQQQFADTVPQSGLLPKDDIIELFMWFSSVSVGGLSYSKRPRRLLLPRLLSRCKRFPNVGHGWSYSNICSDAVVLSVDTPVFLAGIRLFGAKGATYEVALNISSENLEGSEEIYSLEGSYATDEEQTDGYFGYDIIFDTILLLEENKQYKISAVITGIDSSYGTSGQCIVECDGVHFRFKSQNSPNGTNEKGGQIAEVLFKTNH